MQAHEILLTESLTKNYPDFHMDNVQLDVPYGSIVGLIGENGAGKSTLIKTLLGLTKQDSGEIYTFGKSQDAMRKCDHEKIGVVFDESFLPENYTANKLNKILKRMYSQWDEDIFFSMLKRLMIPTDKAIKKLSKGMKMKLSVVIALSHYAKLLILDEPTSGLDPVVRDDILDLLLEFIQAEDHAVLLSSHITSDLEKIADYIVFIHDGRIMFQIEKDTLLYQYGVVKCTGEQFAKMNKTDVIRYRKLEHEIQVLVSDRQRIETKYPDFIVASVTIEEIMLLFIRGEVQ